MLPSTPLNPRDETGTERGPARVAAFFDMDNTLLRGSSGRLYLRYLRQIGYFSTRQWLRVLGRVALYITKRVDFPHLMGWLMTQVAGASEAEAWRISAAWHRAMLRDAIADGARERIAWHRDQGHHVAIVSAATPYAVEPVARDLGLGDAYLATRLEVVAGRFTGQIQSPACYGPGKVPLARAYATKHNISLAQSYFYTDSSSDAPLLAAVGHPVAVHPDRRLARMAAEHNWPIMRFY